MGITAISGPHLVFGITQGSTGQVAEYNEERGPSIYDLGYGTADPRYQFSYDPGNAVGTQVKAFYHGRAFVDYKPYAASSASISAKASMPAAGTACTLSPSTALGGITTTIIAPENGASVSVIAFESTASVLTFGSAGTVAMWNPAFGAGRAIWISGTSTADAGSITVAGRDVYGFKVSETISLPFSSVGSLTGGASGTIGAVGAKAFKYITGVTPSSSSTLTSTSIWVGFADIYGLPLLATYASQDLVIRLAATSSDGKPTLNSTGGITIGSTSTATATTGDVRGTYLSTTATNGTVRLQISQMFNPVMANSITASDVSAFFGVTQYSSA